MVNEKKKPILNDMLSQYGSSIKHPQYEYLQWISIPLLVFGLMGLVWSIPFPFLTFLGKYNGFVNWASFLIAVYIYYFYKKSPLFSYIILLAIFAFSAGIVGLEKLDINGGWPQPYKVCLVVFLAGIFLHSIWCRLQQKPFTISSLINSMLVGPIWLMRSMLKNDGKAR